jgi:hypothetical protein
MHQVMRYTTAALALCGALLLISGCAHKVSNSWPDDVNKTYRAVVQTTWPPAAPANANDLDRLKAYYAGLQQLVGTNNLEEQYIGCLECAQFGTGVPPTKLTFIFFQQHSKDLYAFMTAWKRVQASALGTPNFTLTFDNEAPPSAACGAPVPTCYPIPTCVMTSYCDANRAQIGCQPCP